LYVRLILATVLGRLVGLQVSNKLFEPQDGVSMSPSSQGKEVPPFSWHVQVSSKLDVMLSVDFGTLFETTVRTPADTEYCTCPVAYPTIDRKHIRQGNFATNILQSAEYNYYF
jgi:hypothetical protein